MMLIINEAIIYNSLQPRAGPRSCMYIPYVNPLAVLELYMQVTPPQVQVRNYVLCPRCPLFSYLVLPRAGEIRFCSRAPWMFYTVADQS